MPVGWRIVKEKQVSTAFSGEGAAKAGGRWNSRGVAVVYTSASKSLAALETIVHLNPPVLFKYKIIRIEFADELVEKISAAILPRDWRAEPPPPSTKWIGDAWVRESRCAILAVPSVIISDEVNYMLNPAHPNFKKVALGEPEDFAFDPRLL
jgi:RES domain-containing protein